MPRSGKVIRRSGDDNGLDGGTKDLGGEKDPQSWMDGRAAFIFPESRPSNVAKRDIVSDQGQHDRMNQIQDREIDARRSMSEDDIKAEIDEYYRSLEQERRKKQPPSVD